MKPVFVIKKDLIAYSFAAIILGSASSVSLADTNSEAVFQTSGGISYVSGGVGEGSIDRLNSLSRNFNLKLVFAMKSGEYVSGVRVIIADKKGKELLDTTSDGPWFLTRLPAGDYQISATLNGKKLNHHTAIGEGKIRTVDFRWGSE